MRHVYLSEQDEQTAFAKRAAKHFAAHPEHWSFADGNPEAGQLLALRWGLGEDCVAIMRLDANFEPTIYAQLIRGYQD